MSDYIVVLIVVALFFLVPQTRKAALEMLGVTAIAGIGVAVLALPVWALYRAESWREPPQPSVTATEDGAGQLDALLQTQEAERRRLEEERRRQEEEEQRRRAEEQARIAGIAESARSIVERERVYAEVVASTPRLPGAERISADLIRIRIPSWRDTETAEREKELILSWLQTIGLTPEETASIRTANGWGSVWDLWRAESAPPVAEPAEGEQGTAASAAEPASAAAEPEAEPEAEPASEPEVVQEPEPETEPEPELPQLARPALSQPRAVAPRPVPRSEPTPPRRPAPTRRPATRPAPEPEVGPFGY